MTWKNPETGEWLTKVVVAEQSWGEGPIVSIGTLVGAIASMTRVLESIPEEFRDAAQFEIEADDGRPEFTVYYERLATADEIDAEIAEQEARREARRRRDLAQLARLQEMYGDQ